MAGESPDKSEQKQSSGETAENTRDPRLTVLRDGSRKPEKAREPEKATASSVPASVSSSGATASSGASASASAPGAKASSGAGATSVSAPMSAPVSASGRELAGKPATADAVGGPEMADQAGEKDKGSESAKPGKADIGDKAVGAGKKDGEHVASGSASAGSASRKAAAGSDSGTKRASVPKPASGESEASGEPVTAGEKGRTAVTGGTKADEARGGYAPGKTADEGKSGDEGRGRDEDKSGDQAGSAATSDEAPATGEPKGDKAGKAKPKAVDQPTAVFAAPAAARDGRAPVDDATRAFAIAKPKSAASGTAASASTESEAGEGRGSEPKAGASKDIAPKGGASKGDAPKAAGQPKKDAEPASKGAASSKKAAAAGESASGSKPVSDDKPASADETAGNSSGKATSDASGKSAGATADKTAGGGTGKATGTPGDKSREVESDSERTSRFVALKSADAPPIKPPKPVTGKPGDTAAGKPGAKGKADGKAKAKAKDGAKDSAKDVTKDSTKSRQGSAERAPGALPDAQPAATGPSAQPDAERTQQQPLPPLDLLAQLTNTPPPPETPMRTIVRRFKIWTPLVVLLGVIFVVVQAVRPVPAPKLALGDSAAYTFKGSSFTPPFPDQGQSAAKVVGVGSLGTYGPQKPVPTASVAKVMTAYVILKDHPLKVGEKGATITVDAQAEADAQKKDESRVPLKEGQTFTQQQMLQMLMIPSGNNAARLLARWDAKSEAEFVKKMNAAAKDLGMTNTTYTDPSGLDAGTKSTAVDQLKLAEEVMKNGAFRKVVALPNQEIPGLPEKIYNNNDLLTKPSLTVRGIKTGSSSPAGGALMWASYRTVGDKDQLILGVTMDQRADSTDPNAHLKLALENTEPVIKAIRDELVSDTVLKKGQVVGYVDDGLGGHTPVVATKDVRAVGWSGMKATMRMADGGKAVPHTAKAGTEVGVLTVGTGDAAVKVPVALQKDLAEPSFGAKLKRLG
ncbi:serine hydrolase [Streptomyces sp. NPDC003077]|uniref:D-alanyl-D-alanine carboxypeptidase n=1 Tax=Streptomyces sp. NPDC003077 TaxID=3154443 RepID=UPI00339FB234